VTITFPQFRREGSIDKFDDRTESPILYDPQASIMSMQILKHSPVSGDSVINNLTTSDERAEFTLRKSTIEGELTDARLLQKLSLELLEAEETSSLYQKFVDAAVTIMKAQYASMQMLYEDRWSPGKLKLLATSGFSPEAEEYWHWVDYQTASPCGAALRAGKRVVMTSFAECDSMQGTGNLKLLLEARIVAGQSTPLYSRSGKLLGMISTHWDHVHVPTERELSMLDILARQAADLIERGQTLDALKQSEERLRALTIATSDVIYRMSADWSEMYYLDGENFLSAKGAPETNWLQKYIIPEESESVWSVIQDAIANRKTLQLEHKVVGAGRRHRWILSRAIPIQDKEGNIVEWFGVATDITARKQYEKELEHRVENRTRELQRSNEDLLQFAHVASHDLKEPVRKIKTFTYRLQDTLPNIDERAQTYLDKILTSADRMSSMIDGVLAYSSASGFEPTIQVVNLHETLENIQADLEIAIHEKGATFRLEGLPYVEGAPVLLYQLFYNLVNNSLKFSKANVAPVISIKGESIQVSGKEHSRIEVSDNGIGFDPIHNKTIFDTFTRLHSKSEYEGTGLGLSLCRKIVEFHKGTIEANGNKDVGAVFIVTLPLKQQV
jgi:signal transduction histidine kinase